jgi:glycosyl-4,4'-diaponeurosporenoate acyltransferase
VSADPSPTAKSFDLSTLNSLTSAAVAYWSGMLIWLVVLIVWWFARGPGHPAVALIVTVWTVVLTPGVAVPVLRRLPPRWCSVPAGERILHRVLGVWIFGWLLERSGWNRRNAYITWGTITRTRLRERALAARGGGGAHGACFAIHILLAALALLTGHPWGALWILLPGVVVHLYPVLLQRSIMLRLQPLLDKSGS